MKFIDTLFEPDEFGQTYRVPLSSFQAFTFQRLKLEEARSFTLASDYGRYEFLHWFLAEYCRHRAPLRAPFSAEQIKWLLEPEAAYASQRPVPRIADLFWRRNPVNLPNPYGSLEEYTDFAFIWCFEMAPSMNIEDILLPEAFVRALALRIPSDVNELIPRSVFLEQFARRNPGIGWIGSSPSQRLASYIRVLCEPRGCYYSLFFHETVLGRIAALKEVLHLPADGFRADFPAKLALRVAEAKAYHTRYALLRSANTAGSPSPTRLKAVKSDHTADGRSASVEMVKIASPAREPVSIGLTHAVRVIGPINSQSGLGQAARMSIKCLRAAGFEPEIIDFPLDNPTPHAKLVADTGYDSSRSAINIIHLNAESLPLAGAYMDSSVFSNSYNIGYFFWELPRAAACHRLALRMVDEVWVASDFNADIYRSAGASCVTNIGIAVEPVGLTVNASTHEIRRRFGLVEDAFLFLGTFDSYSFLMRKNPTGVVKAFKKAFPDGSENVALVLKTHNMVEAMRSVRSPRGFHELEELVASDPRITLLDATMSYSDLILMKSSSDCYISLHRSEGFGFGMIESMQLGLPVIATNFSGNLEFCNNNTSMLVDWTPRLVGQDDYIFVQLGDHWAEPDLTHAAEHMRRISRDKLLANEFGTIAKTFVAKNFTPQEIGRRYHERLSEISAQRDMRRGAL